MSERRHAVSVSLGSPTRDSRIETELLGVPVLLERRGVGGDVAAAKRMVRELDGEVDAIGLGGTDLWVSAGSRRYPLRQAQEIARCATRTPVVGGEGLKDTLERIVVGRVDRELGLADRRIFVLSGVDRPGMAEALSAAGADLVFGDLIFALGVRWPIRRLRTLWRIAAVIAPIVALLPMAWLYPTGSKQDASEDGWRARYFAAADVIAGDFLFVKRYAPRDLRGKILITNTTTPSDLAMLRERGLATLVTTTPSYDGRSLSTNLLEAGLIAASGEFPLSSERLGELVAAERLEGTITRLDA